MKGTAVWMSIVDKLWGLLVILPRSHMVLWMTMKIEHNIIVKNVSYGAIVLYLCSVWSSVREIIEFKVCRVYSQLNWIRNCDLYGKMNWWLWNFYIGSFWRCHMSKQWRRWLLITIMEIKCCRRSMTIICKLSWNSKKIRVLYIFICF